MFNKYFPKNIDDFIGNEKARIMMKNFIKCNNIPNMIIVGDHGIGKSTLCTLLLQEYFGEYYENFSLIIRGSIDRGKDMVSEYSDKKKKQDSCEGYKCSSFISKTLKIAEGKTRIIIVYDFDKMTDNAQQTLKTIIEEKSNRARFIFICNETISINEAIQSRATPIEMFHLTKDQITTRLKEITTLEKGSNIINNEIYEIINLLSNGDLKKSLNYLQVYLNSINTNNANNTNNADNTDNTDNANNDIDNFYNIFNIPHISIITDIITNNNLNTSISNLTTLIKNGFNSIDIFEILLKVLQSETLIIDQKIRIQHLSLTAKIYKKYILSSSDIHMYELICQFVNINNMNVYI